MGAIVTSPHPEVATATDGFLPQESPLAMSAADLGRPPHAVSKPVSVGAGMLMRRALVLVLTAALTGAGAYEMYMVVQVGGVTIMEGMVLVLFVALLAWIAFSFASALAGFFALLRRNGNALPIRDDGPLPQLASRTAVLLPTYNENPHQLMARLRAIYESVEATGQGDNFDWFVLSDTRDPDIWIAEERAFLELCEACGAQRLFYRHRADNTARKSGNVGEWITRFGGAYRFMIVLDADSLMSGDTMVRMVHAMESNPQAALLQTLPVIVNARSLFSRLQQFAGRLYGPMVAAGVAWWHGSEGNYWGHNAIIRIEAFAQQAGLPELSGRKPFGGHILSHDFVEAALMRRAGWGIYMAPMLGGSFEEVPPSLLDFAARDRRWCQGNLQHLAVLRTRRLHWISRLHFMTGIGSYITAPLWLSFLLLGILISLQARFIRPEYFPKGFSLFPNWPAQDPVLAAWVFGLTMALLIVPKLLGFLLLLTRSDVRRQFGGGFRALTGVIAEVLISAMIAPVMMVFQSIAVVEILLGRDAGWQTQRRDDGAVERRELYRKYGVPTACGVAMAISAWAVSLPLLLWMSPVIVGLLFAIPIGAWTARPAMHALFVTPEEAKPPRVLVRANELAASPAHASAPALATLRQDPALLHRHLSSLPPARRGGPGEIDLHLAVARARIEASDSFDQAVRHLTPRETLAVLGDSALLEGVLAK
ncbi:membrane glycosyltransferase [Bradyrhizobium japonicum]|jgi:membrane glycosyltransferase|uniref:Glucans biosynthesis glucosyltransferase H n=1 Tax=Bradyrhizobium elkanii TaxID=29448 RepID=A0A4Q4K705_BRAEL|nr:MULTISPECIES: glucans biosynthesis glucosyltransferase MdoH [Bradyrhizobium]MBP1298750.1 membrane glycosyltransferase [Bradyrhizobium elkanii]MCP1729934.1 membrane glycosyltransferase [Bradyrhizobium elkanii]MCP1930389.1 membrane glycosyltransferase [Bradyrhizobium elkanii]MCS3481352.1 membrane glycosyltransferase [Bradyrhizobium elkanii]MCS3518197.1 membrane glycosyltransferase [Bradyrhizobium elkanii]